MGHLASDGVHIVAAESTNGAMPKIAIAPNRTLGFQSFPDLFPNMRTGPQNRSRGFRGKALPTGRLACWELTCRELTTERERRYLTEISIHVC